MRYIRRAIVVSLFLAASGAVVLEAQTNPTAHIYRVVSADTLRLYVFQPPATQPRTKPAILLYHGGGWSQGSAEWTFGSARAFTDQGMVAIAVQYRLSGSTLTPLDALEDVCESVRWVRRNAQQLGIDSAKVAGHGVSAGGHLIASTATVGCSQSRAMEGSVPNALLLWSAALDVTGDKWFKRLLLGKAEPVAVSPAQHVHRRTPPTSIVQGDKDTLTPLAGARLYCERLTALGTECELNVYEGVGHLLTRNLTNQESDFDPDPRARAHGNAKHIAFLRSRGFPIKPPLPRD